jgi:cytochrome c biogenesis protein CcmG, thiol:disulfide interchange protein DsbE
MNDDGFAEVETPQKSQLPLWIILIIGVVFVIVWVLFLKPQISMKRAMQAAGVGQSLVALDLQPLTGATEALTFESLRGKVTLINFWGTWCPPCIREFPHMIELWDEFREQPDFKFVSVSSTFDAQENVEDVREKTLHFLKSRSTAMPTYIDANGATRQLVASVLGQLSFGYPTTIVLDRKGVIRGTWTGYESGDEHQMQKLVAKLLSEK